MASEEIADISATEVVSENVLETETTGDSNVSEEAEAVGNSTPIVIAVVVILAGLLVVLLVKRKNK